MSSEVRGLPLGKALAALIDYRGKTPTKTASGVKLVTAKVIKGGRIADENHEFIAEDQYEIWMRRGLPRQWDILITTEAPLGEVAMLRSPERVALAQRVILLRADKAIADQKYLFQALKSPLVQARLNARATGTTVLGIKQSELVQVEIPLPALSAQRRIASILSAYDDLIENNTRRIAILEEMARRIYEEWFVRFRFPGHEGVRLLESELGLVPEGWESVRMDSICARITDGSHYSPKSVESGKPMASVKDMHDWGIELSTCRQIADVEYEKLVRNDCKPKLNDVLIAKDGSYLKHTFVVDQELDLVILSSIAILRPNGKMAPNQLAMYLRLPDVASRMKGYVSGVAIPRIVLRDFRQFLVLLAPKEIQGAWASLCDPMLSLCRTLVRKNTNLRTTRDLLLPKLISGELDVSAMPEPEALAG